MNPLLAKLHPYPFERLKSLTRGITPEAAFRPIGLGIGEPRHATPALIERALLEALPGLSSYPATSAFSISAGVAWRGSPMPRLMGGNAGLGVMPCVSARRRSNG